MPRKTAMLVVKVPEEMLREIDAVASAAGKTRSELVREALALLIYLYRHFGDPDPMSYVYPCGLGYRLVLEMKSEPGETRAG